jgi:tripartite-type tricarboxylate transporter receptor subunit TctC
MLPYDPLKDFVPVSMIPRPVLANPSVPVKGSRRFIAFDKPIRKARLRHRRPAQPIRHSRGVLNKLGGSPSSGAYAAMPQGVQDALAGRVQLIVLAVPSAAQHIASGALRPLATSSAERLSNYPQVPAIAETFAGVEFIGWFVPAAPAGTPDEIVIRVNR